MINKAREKIQLESLEALKDNDYEGFIILPTGTGKGWVLIQCLKKLKPKRCLYLCDSEDNRDTTFKEELKKWDAEDWIDKIDYQCYQTAYKYEDEKYDLVLADEADYALTPEYSKFFFNNQIRRKILVSATLSEEKKVIAEKIVPIVYEKNIGEIEDAGVLNKAQCYFVNYMLSPAENKEYLKFNEQFVKLIDRKERASTKSEKKAAEKNIEFLITQRALFLKGLKSSEKICKSLLKFVYLQNDNNRIIIFCGLTDQAERICKYSYHSKNHKDGWFEKFDNGEIRILSVVGKIDRGVNINGVNNIVFEAPSKSRTKFVQKSGRGRRLNVNDTLTIYFLIPYFTDRYGNIKPTIVQKWVYDSAKDLDLEKAKVFKLNGTMV